MKTLFILLCFAPFIYADAPAGYYSGTVGKSKVHACFGDDIHFYIEGEGKTKDLAVMEQKPGAYLESEPSHMEFPEDYDPESGTLWEIAVTDGKITGFRKPAKEEQEPIQLTFVSKDCLPGYEDHRLNLPFENKNKV